MEAVSIYVCPAIPDLDEAQRPSQHPSSFPTCTPRGRHLAGRSKGAQWTMDCGLLSGMQKEVGTEVARAAWSWKQGFQAEPHLEALISPYPHHPSHSLSSPHLILKHDLQ